MRSWRSSARPSAERPRRTDSVTGCSVPAGQRHAVPLRLRGMDPAFDSYRLSDEHEALREAVRALAEKEIAPYAADVDEQGRYPVEARDALVRVGFHAVIIPEEYGGQGADELAGAIVIEEVARVCASSSLIPAVNGLGLTPILLSASEELKQQVLPSIAAGEAMISYALSEREAGSDAASMRTRARLDGNSWVINGKIGRASCRERV